MKLIAESAWHHEGDFSFFSDLVRKILQSDASDILKFHLSLNIEEYASPNHPWYEIGKRNLFSLNEWTEIFEQVKRKRKELLLLYNDQQSIEFGSSFNPEFVEIHSVALNDIFLLDCLKENINEDTGIFLGVGGCSFEEIDAAISYLNHENIILMFGFQNYPTKYSDINFRKVKALMEIFSSYKFGYADHCGWDEENNEMITLVGASLGMSFIEKHVTTALGEQRADFQSAISIDQLVSLREKLKVLEECFGTGQMELNDAEKKYSVYGPMKKAGLYNKDLEKGHYFSKEDFSFKRTKEVSELSQLQVLSLLGMKTRHKVQEDHFIKESDFEKS